MAKKKKKIVQKDAGYVNTSTVSTSSPPVASQPFSQQHTPNTTMSNQMMSWPAPDNWHLQGHDAAKKAALQYIVTVNEYLHEQDVARKIELASQMNSIVESLINGINIGLDAAKLINDKIRTGDQSAQINMGSLKGTLESLAKTVWIHNYVALRGAPGLQMRLIDSQLVGNLNRLTGLAFQEDGIPLPPGVDPNSLWLDNQMSGQGDALPTQAPAEEEVLPEGEPPAEEPSPEESNPDVTANQQETPPISQEQLAEQVEEEPPPTDEPADIENEDAGDEEIEGLEEEEPGEEPAGEEVVEGVPDREPETEEEIPDEALAELMASEQAQAGQGEGVPSEEVPEAEEPVEEPPVPEDETAESEEETEPPGEETALEPEPEPEEEPESEPLEEDSEDLEQEEPETVPEGEPSEDESEEPEPELEEEPEEESEVEGEEDTESDDEGESEEMPESDDDVEEDESDEEDTRYCIVCDRVVTQEEIAECDNPSCPFQQQEEEAPEEEPETTEKHYIIVDYNDHSGCEKISLQVKEYTGLDVEYCRTCNKALSYSFDQDIWSSEDAKRWMSKKIASDVVRKSPEEQIIEKWLKESREQVAPEPKEDEIDFDVELLESVVSKKLQEVTAPLAELKQELRAITG